MRLCSVRTGLTLHFIIKNTSKVFTVYIDLNAFVKLKYILNIFKFEMKLLLIPNTIYEKPRRVKVRSHGSQWKLMEGDCNVYALIALIAPIMRMVNSLIKPLCKTYHFYAPLPHMFSNSDTKQNGEITHFARVKTIFLP